MESNFLSVRGCGKIPPSSRANASHSWALSVLKFQNIHPDVCDSKASSCASIYPRMSFLKVSSHSAMLFFPLQVPTTGEFGCVPSYLAPTPYPFNAGAQSVMAADHSPTTSHLSTLEAYDARLLQTCWRCCHGCIATRSFVKTWYSW